MLKGEDRYKVYWVDGTRIMQVYSTNDRDRAFYIGRQGKPDIFLLIIKEYEQEIYRGWE